MAVPGKDQTETDTLTNYSSPDYIYNKLAYK